MARCQDGCETGFDFTGSSHHNSVVVVVQDEFIANTIFQEAPKDAARHVVDAAVGGRRSFHDVTIPLDDSQFHDKIIARLERGS